MAEIGKARLIELAEAKLEDAKLLLGAGRPANAYYLAGYAVELIQGCRVCAIQDRYLAGSCGFHAGFRPRFAETDQSGASGCKGARTGRRRLSGSPANRVKVDGGKPLRESRC